MKHLTATLLFCFATLFAYAGEWLKIDSQDSKTWYIYTDIQDEYGNHLVWIRTTYDTPEARRQAMNNYHTKYHVFEDKMLYSFNSGWTQMALKSAISYSKSGQVLDSYNSPYDEWNYITPGTIGEMWRNAAKYIYDTAYSN